MASGDNENKSKDVFCAKNIWYSLNELRLEGQLCDAFLSIENTRLPVHRAVLAANSSYFRALFTNGMKESTQTDIKIPDINEKTMKDILDYIYTRDVKLSLDQADEVLKYSELFLVIGLADRCATFLQERLSVDNCIHIYRFAERHFRPELQQAARTFILQHYSAVSTASNEFSSLSVRELVSFLSDDRLNVRSEEAVFESIVRWIDFDPAARAEHVSELLPCVRLGLVRPDYFLARITPHAYLEAVPVCKPLIQRAWEFLFELQRLRCPATARYDPADDAHLVRPRVPHEVLFAIGGWSSGTPITCMETYDTCADRWYTQRRLEDTSPRSYHGLVSLRQRIYVIGGFNGARYYNSVREFDPVTGRWREIAPMYTQRCYLSAAVPADGCIYACGGYDGRQRLNTVERWEPVANQWSHRSRMHHRRSDAGCDSVQDKIFIMGGFDGERCLSTSEVYDVKTDQWTLIPSMSIPRSGVAVINYQGFIYAIGGFDGATRQRSAEKYCPETRQWVRVADMFAPRSNFAVSVIDNMIFCVGGFNGDATIAHVECYDSSTDQWYDAADMNVNRSALKTCVMSGLPNAVSYTMHGSHDQSGEETAPRNLSNRHAAQSPEDPLRPANRNRRSAFL